uniref:Secreted protein n=1 Tax=Panagrellus redivivus TaxID=6233 RepID=A0A7E5A0K1_PANRE
MQLVFIAFIIGAVVCFGHAEVKLKLYVNVTVAFEGDELLIQIDNPDRIGDNILLCFGSTPNSDECYFCPLGYAGALIMYDEVRQVWKLSRSTGKITRSQYYAQIMGDIVFEHDGTIKVLVVRMPYGGSVSLPNAEIPVATTTLASRKEVTNSNATVSIIIAVVILILIVFIISAALVYYCWYKKRGTSVPVPNVHQTPDEVLETEESLRPMATETRVPSPLKRPVSVPSATTPTRKVSDEKQQVANVAKPVPIVPVASPSCVSIITANTQPSTLDAISRQKSGIPKASRKFRQYDSTTSQTTQSDKLSPHCK